MPMNVYAHPAPVGQTLQKRLDVTNAAATFLALVDPTNGLMPTVASAGDQIDSVGVRGAMLSIESASAPNKVYWRTDGVGAGVAPTATLGNELAYAPEGSWFWVTELENMQLLGSAAHVYVQCRLEFGR